MISLFEKAHQIKLTETEKTIIAFFEERPVDVLYMNLNDLCSKLFTSNATIVRLCQKLGLSGYNDFKYQLRSELKKKKNKSFYADDYIMHSIARFQDTIAGLDIERTEEIVDYLTSERPLYVYGSDLCALPARYLQIALTSIDIPSILIEWSGLLNGLIKNMNSDSVLFITTDGNNELYLEPMRIAQERGITTILLTNDYNSALIPYSTVAVCTGDQENICGNSSEGFRIGFYTIIQILIELSAGKKQNRK